MHSEAGGEPPPGKVEYLASKNPQEARDEGASILHNGPYAQEGDYRLSLRYFAAAQKENPDFITDPWFNYDMGICAVRSGKELNVKIGIHLLEESLRLQEERQEPISEWMQIGLAEAYGRADRYDDAKKAYETARMINPHNEQATFLDGDENTRADRAWALHDEAKHDASEGKKLLALIKYERAIILGGEDAMAWSTHDKGKVLLSSGQVQEAIKELSKAAELIPDNTWTHSSFATALEQADIPSERQRAKYEYTQALELDNDNNEAREGLNRLRDVPDLPRPKRPSPPQQQQYQPPQESMTEQRQEPPPGQEASGLRRFIPKIFRDK
jgi:tetratricopeptide (TPR) repeat protein